LGERGGCDEDDIEAISEGSVVEVEEDLILIGRQVDMRDRCGASINRNADTCQRLSLREEVAVGNRVLDALENTLGDGSEKH
jgi:hypothetical protein